MLSQNITISHTAASGGDFLAHLHAMLKSTMEREGNSWPTISYDGNCDPTTAFLQIKVRLSYRFQAPDGRTFTDTVERTLSYESNVSIIEVVQSVQRFRLQWIAHSQHNCNQAVAALAGEIHDGRLVLPEGQDAVGFLVETLGRMASEFPHFVNVPKS